jgi:glutaredoxin
MVRPDAYPIPYLSRLEGGGLQPGQSVCIRGAVLGERFSINLLAGDNPDRDDIPFHISVRMDEKKFVFNNRQGGEWKKEERKSCPYKYKAPKEDEEAPPPDTFDIRVRAHDNKFEVMVNQKELAEFEYRVPLTQINHLYIEGACELHGVNWGGKYYSVPYEAGIEGGFGPGKKLFVTGVPDKDCKRFSVNLKTKDGQIALHFNPRFDEKAIVRNSQLAGAWGNEEREGKLPLQKQKAFDLTIHNESYSFQVFIDGQQFCTFAHRTDPHDVYSLAVDGDLELQGIHVK